MLLILHAIQGALMWCNLHFVPWSRLAMKRGFMYTMRMVKIAQPLFVDVIGYLISMWSRGFICEAFFACYLCNILWRKRECIFSFSLFLFIHDGFLTFGFLSSLFQDSRKHSPRSLSWNTWGSFHHNSSAVINAVFEWSAL